MHYLLRQSLMPNLWQPPINSSLKKTNGTSDSQARLKKDTFLKRDKLHLTLDQPLSAQCKTNTNFCADSAITPVHRKLGDHDHTHPNRKQNFSA